MSAAGRTPTREQAQAAARRDRDVFLEAGAGTGKTGVLVERYCDAVSADGVAPEQVLAFTFTEKAAAELRRRIRAELESRAEAAEGDEAVRLADAVRSLGAAPITTIHGFCRRLLASHPIAAGLDPRFRVLDAAEARRVGWAAFDAALEDFVGSAGDDGERVIALYGVQRAREIVLRAHEELVSRGELPLLPPVTARDSAAAFAEIEAAGAAMTGAGKGNAKQKECVEQARQLVSRGPSVPPTLPELESLDPGGDSSVPEVAACQAAIGAAVAITVEAGEGMRAYEALGRLLEAYAARYAEAKTERSGLDFEDLQRGAVDLLHRSHDLGVSYSERFTHLLVDEFQDTNALQLALIRALHGPETRLFCVGDEFQAIYGFRHADIDIFTGERAAFSARAGAEALRLSGNFRSQPQIVAAVNAVGRALLPGFLELTTGRPEAPPVPTELLVADPDGWDEHTEVLERADGDRTPLACLVEARMLAQRLRALVDDEGRHPGEMVILLRAFTQVEAFEAALERAGLPAHVVGGGGYWSRLQAQDMIALLGAIANPLADEPLLGALASPAAGVRPDTLWVLRQAAGHRRSIWSAVLTVAGLAEPELEDAAALIGLPPEERERLTRFATVVDTLRRAGTRLPLETLLGRAVEETGYDLGILMSDHGRERYANVRKMMRLARDFEAVEGRDLRGFLDYAALSAEQDSEPPAAVESEEGSGVRIMTVHSAKGLEFPVVAVAQLGRDLLRGGRGGDLVLSRPAEDPLRAGLRLPRLGGAPLKLFGYEELVDAALGRDVSEELRLAYVAVTRARERLLLSGLRTTTPHKDDRALSVMRRLLAHLGVDELTGSTSVPIPPPQPLPGSGAQEPDGACIVVTATAPSEEEATRLAVRHPPLPTEPVPPPAPPPLVEQRPPALPPRALSYSALSEHARCGYRFYVERVIGLGAQNDGGPGAAGGERDRALRLGNATHELLRRSAESRWAAPSEAASVAALERHGFDAADTAAHGQIERQVGGWLSTSLPAALRGGGVRLRAEHPFLLDLAATTVRGSIDLLAERPGKPPLVIDYKTDRLNGDAPVDRAERYSIQRDLYALAVAEGLGAREVEVAYVFLERPEAPASVLLGEGALSQARERLVATVEAVSAGSFEVTPAPDWPLCRDCPARRRLCPAPAAPPAGTG